MQAPWSGMRLPANTAFPQPLCKYYACTHCVTITRCVIPTGSTTAKYVSTTQLSIGLTLGYWNNDRKGRKCGRGWEIFMEFGCYVAV